MLSRFFSLGSSIGTRFLSSAFPPLCKLTEEDEMLKEMVGRFSKDRVEPLRKIMDEKQELDAGILKDLFEQGLMGIEIPEEYGGANLSFVSSCVAIEELAKVDPSVAIMVDVQNTLVINSLMSYASKELLERPLPSLASDTVGCFCLSEASSGSDAFSLKATAEEKSDRWVLNGSKLWISSAKQGGLFVVFASVDRSKGHKGITAFLVPRDAPGFSIGRKEDKLGLRASATCEVLLDNCEIPKENLIGEIGKGYKIAISTLNEGRIGIAAQMCGLAQGAFDCVLPYLFERKQFGKFIGDFQAMQTQYAEVATEIHAARLLTYEAARMRENGLPFVQQAAMAKWFSSEVAVKAARKSIEWFGGVGFTKEFDAEKFYRDSIIGTIYEGTSIMNLVTIAKNVRELYASKQ
uniref:Short/branched chain specific acyl-CoA dehydrogenase, mitochondrial n=1 Tax=Stygiella incarcerata TaxID=1712417 RepID=A0A192ZJ21_9EUKA|nr:branched-chain acyl-CoA dehydrogenase [Stygiella incarcerata]